MGNIIADSYSKYTNTVPNFEKFHNQVINMPRPTFTEIPQIIKLLKSLAEYILLIDEEILRNPMQAKDVYGQIYHNYKIGLIPKKNRNEFFENTYLRHSIPFNLLYEDIGRRFRHYTELLSFFDIFRNVGSRKNQFDIDALYELVLTPEPLLFDVFRNGCMDDISQDPQYASTYDVCVAFWVSKIIRSLDKSGVSDLLHIEVNDHNFEQFSFDLPISDIHDYQSLMGKLAANRLLIPPTYRNLIPYYLFEEYRHCVQARRIEYRHNGLGWYNHHGDVLFLYDKNDVNGIPSYYAKNNVQFVKGNATAYTDFLCDVVLPVPTLALGLALGYSAVVVSRLKEEYDFGTIIINLCGASSTGKTTIEQLLVSPFACPIPKNGSGLIHTFHATTNALYASLEGINGLPIVLDDATTNPYLNLPNLIYTLATGQGRSRCNSEGDVKEARPSWSGVIVVSSETPIQDDSCQNQGLQVRVLQTQGITWTPDAPTAELIKSTVQKHYGHTGKQFADFVAKIPIEKLCALFDEAKKNVKRLMVHRDNLSDRLEIKYAAIWLTIYLMNKCFGYKLNPQALTGIFINPEQESVLERDISLKSLNVMNNYILENYARFSVCDHTPQQDPNQLGDNSKGASGSNYGTIVLNGSTCDVFIPSDKVKDILKAKGINEFSTVKKRWKEKGIIVCEKDRYTDKDSLKRRCIHFVYPKGLKTDIPDEFYQETEQHTPFLQATSVDVTDWNANDGIDEIFGEFDCE